MKSREGEGRLGDGIWLIAFIYLYETELKNLLQLLSIGVGRGLRGMRR
jgi:hypothetical protein